MVALDPTYISEHSNRPGAASIMHGFHSASLDSVSMADQALPDESLSVTADSPYGFMEDSSSELPYKSSHSSAIQSATSAFSTSSTTADSYVPIRTPDYSATFASPTSESLEASTSSNIHHNNVLVGDYGHFATSQASMQPSYPISEWVGTNAVSGGSGGIYSSFEHQQSANVAELWDEHPISASDGSYANADTNASMGEFPGFVSPVKSPLFSRTPSVAPEAMSVNSTQEAIDSPDLETSSKSSGNTKKKARVGGAAWTHEEVDVLRALVTKHTPTGSKTVSSWIRLKADYDKMYPTTIRSMHALRQKVHREERKEDRPRKRGGVCQGGQAIQAKKKAQANKVSRNS